MLNTCLTVRAHEANSHSNRGWEKFTQKVIDLVAKKRTTGVVFLAWGAPAGKRVGKVDRKRHLVLQSVHPSPLSASRGWFDCGHFKKCNEWLVGRYGEGSEIDWDLGGASQKEVAKKVEKKEERSENFDVVIEEMNSKTAEKKEGIDDEFEIDEEALAALDEAEKGI